MFKAIQTEGQLKPRRPLTVKEILAQNCHSRALISKKNPEESGTQQETVPWDEKLQPSLSMSKKNCENTRPGPSQNQATNGLVVSVRAEKVADNLGGKGSGSGQIFRDDISQERKKCPYS